MKQILKHGDAEKAKEALQTYEFTCFICGCTFTADRRDYRLIEPDLLILSECPDCGAGTCFQAGTKEPIM